MQIIDCFITSHKPLSNERSYFYELTKWSLIGNGVDIIQVINKPMLERYFECERLAKTDIYILCDNDIITATPDTLPRLIEIMIGHPEYSQLGLGWRRNMMEEAENSWIRNKEGEIWEMDHVGGIMAIRKGTIKDLGYKAEYESGYGDDRVMGKTARKLGYKVGIVPSLYFYHLGADYSTFI